MEDNTKKTVTFPIKIDAVLNEEIDTAVFFTKADSKKSYILNAIRKQVKEDLTLNLMKEGK